MLISLLPFYGSGLFLFYGEIMTVLDKIEITFWIATIVLVYALLIVLLYTNEFDLKLRILGGIVTIIYINVAGFYLWHRRIKSPAKQKYPQRSS
jgi:uncharacterized membrane protein YkvI